MVPSSTWRHPVHGAIQYMVPSPRLKFIARCTCTLAGAKPTFSAQNILYIHNGTCDQSSWHKDFQVYAAYCDGSLKECIHSSTVYMVMYIYKSVYTAYKSIYKSVYTTYKSAYTTYCDVYTISCDIL
jgi:hypothetical protein